MKAKQITPYQRLLDEIRQFVSKLKFGRKYSMFYWKKADLIPQNSWRLDEVYQRTLAANKLGYEVVITADKQGMTFQYREIAKPAWNWED